MVIFNLCKLTTFAYLDCSIFLICCSGLVWESFPTNKVSVAILSMLGDVGLRLTGPISKIVCYHQVLFARVTKLQQFEEKTTNTFVCFMVSQNCKYPHNYPLRICAYVTRKLPVYTMWSQFKHFVGFVNLPNSSTCPMFPYVI